MTEFHHLTVEQRPIVIGADTYGSPWIGECTCGISVYGGTSKQHAERALHEAHHEIQEPCS